MIIRPFQRSDIDELKRIHQEGRYEVEYPFDVFNDPHFIDLFAVDDEGGRLISAGGVRLIPEVVIATDKSRSVRDRRMALMKILESAEFICRNQNFQNLTASTPDEQWYLQLLRYGFRDSFGKPLYYPLY